MAKSFLSGADARIMIKHICPDCSETEMRHTKRPYACECGTEMEVLEE